MRFALLGDHPAGISMAAALTATGRHELTAFSGVGESPAGGAELLRTRGLGGQPVGDLEEILADPSVEAVIVASPLSVRPLHLRRALQSERHVLCVYPPDATPDIAYEAALIQGDTKQVLMALLREPHHPALLRLATLLERKTGPLGGFSVLQVERHAEKAISCETVPAGTKHTLPDWLLLRVLGGEIAEVSAFAQAEEIDPTEPLLLAGRFESGGLFQATLQPGRESRSAKICASGMAGEARLEFPEGLAGPATLCWRAGADPRHEESWPGSDPAPRWVEAFETAVGASGAARQVGWQDAIRCLELDDAARHSVSRRRTHTLEFQEASEEVGFKGTMTLVGCAVLWGIILLAILSAWKPALGWLIVPPLVHRGDS